MPQPAARYMAPPATLAEGWTLARLTPPSRLHGANGLRTGKDGLIYVAQVCGSQVSAVNPDTGDITTISPMGGGITGPDDLAFDDEGNLYCTEITTNRLSVLHPDGTTRVLNGDVPVANPVTVYQNRVIAGELRMGGQIREFDRSTGAARGRPSSSRPRPPQPPLPSPLSTASRRKGSRTKGRVTPTWK